MVHKKYRYVNGKRYGPYLYENSRVGEKVVTHYLGKEKNHSSSNFVVFVLIALVLVIASFILVSQFISPTGKAVLDISQTYISGQNISGNFSLVLKSGELLPASTLVNVSLAGQSQEYLLSDLLPQETSSGNFFSEGANLSGQGDGYGIVGQKVTYPDIDFSLLIQNSANQNESQSGTSGTDTGGSISNQSQSSSFDNVNTSENSSSQQLSQGQDNQSQQEQQSQESNPVQSTADQSSSSSSDSQSSSSDASTTVDSTDSSSGSDGSGSSLTGAVINDFSQGNVINGKTGKDNPFIYSLSDGESASLVSGSVRFNGTSIDDGNVNVQTNSSSVFVSTNFSQFENGFGQDYLGNDTSSISIDLSKLNISASEGVLSISLSYNGENIVSVEKQISLENNANSSVPVENSTSIANESKLILVQLIPAIRIPIDGSYSLNLNDYFSGAENYSIQPILNITSSIAGSELSLTPDLDFKGARQAKITSYSGNESLESNTFNIIVSSSTINIQTVHSPIRLNEPVKWTKNITLDSPDNVSIELPGMAENISVKKIETQSEENASVNITTILTGNVISSMSNSKGSIYAFLSNMISYITGRVSADINTGEQNNASSDSSKQVMLQDNATQYTIQYTTPAPVSAEQNISNGKQVTISDPNNLNYTEILSFTNIPELYNVGQEGRIKIYWVENKSYMPFDAYDLDGNGKLDYVEWITPHLSNQTFDIILISSAEHLDGNRTYLEDVSGYVNTRDYNYTTIPENDYLRVTFQQNLTNKNDITLYAKSENGSIIEVYEKNDSLPLAVFDNITRDQEYKIYLTNLTHSQDTFDLLVLNNSVDFDYVVDPTLLLNQSSQLSSGVTTEPTNITRLNINSTGIPSQNLVAYYSFDSDANSTYFDWSGNGYNGTCYNNQCPILNQTSKYGVGATFNGSMLINITSNVSNWPLGSSNRTVNVWVESNDSGSAGGADHYFFAYGGPSNNQAFIMGTYQGHFIFTQIGGNIQSNTPVLDGKWRMFTVTINSSGANMWVNGVLETVGLGGLINTNTYQAMLGVSNQYAVGSQSFNGTIDDLMIFNSSLNSSQIMDLYNNQSQRFYPTGQSNSKNTTDLAGTWTNVNVSLDNFNEMMGTNISLAIGYNNLTGNFITPPQNISQKNVNYTYNVSGATNITLNFTLISDSKNMWSPLIYGNVTISPFNITASAATLSISFVSPTPSPGLATSNNNLIVNVTATASLGLNNITIYLFNSTNNQINSSNSSTSPFAYTFLGLPDGIYYYNASVYDLSGNANFTGTQNITINSTLPPSAPSINFTNPTPANGTYQSANSIFVNISSNDTNDIYTLLDFDNTLSAWYRFNNESGENSTKYNDWSSYGNNGTCYTGFCPSAVLSARFGKGVNFNGSQFINITQFDNWPYGTTNRTFNAWIKYNGSVDSQDRYFFSYGTLAGSQFFGVGTISGKVIFTQVGSNIQSTSQISDNKWYMVTVNYNGTAQLFVNGVQQASGLSSSVNTIKGQAHFGDSFSVGTQSWNGTLDDAIIFNRSLSPTEILSLYNSSTTQYNNNFTSLAQGSHTFTGYAVNSLGSKNQTETRTVAIDSISPSINFTNPTPANGLFVTNNNLTINLTAADSSGIKNITLFLFNSTNNQINSSNSSTSPFAYTFLGLPDGIYYYNASVYDLAGNANFTATQNIFIDSISPSINFTNPTPANGTYQSADSIFVNISSSSTKDNYALLDFDKSLILWMRLNNESSENATLFRDWSSYGNNGTCYGTACPTLNVTGKFGHAYSFAGQYINITTNVSNFPSGNSARTMGAWINVNSTFLGSGDAEFVSYGTTGGAVNTGWELGVIAGKAFVTQIGASISSTSNVNDGKWHFVLATWNTSTWTLYVDGSAQVNGTTTVNTQAQTFLIGREVESFGKDFNGTIDDVLLFNRTLSSGEISSLYNATANQYYNNFTSLQQGTHTFTGYAVDSLGGLNSTETRNIGLLVSQLTSCGNLSYPNGIYLLQNNIYNYNGTCFTITADNVTLDGQGFTINGTQDPANVYWGVNATTSTNATIRNITILEFGDYNRLNVNDGGGIYLSANNSLINNVNLGLNYQGLLISSTSSNNSMLNSASSFNRIGITVNGQNNILTNVNAKTNTGGDGIDIRGNYTNLTNIQANSNTLSGISAVSSFNIFSNITTNSNAGFGITHGGMLVSGQNNTFYNITTNSNTGLGILFSGSNSSFTNVVANFNTNGILAGTSNIIFSNFVANSNNNTGISISGLNHVFSNITANSNNNTGISIGSNSSNFTNVVANSNKASGISFGTASFNILSNATTMLNNLGLYFSASSQFSNTLINLTSTNNTLYDLNQSKVAVKGAYFIDDVISTYNLQNSSDQIFFQNSSSGEIRFLATTSGAGINGTGLNLIGNSTSDIVIINNSVFVNSVQSGLNRSANITLYNLPTTLANPTILRDGGVCPSSICYNFTSLNAGNVSFNVTGWSNYSIFGNFNLDSCGTLSSPNGIYFLGKNVKNYAGTCFTITADNVTLDGQGHTINGTQDINNAYWGVNVTSVNNVTIKNITILNFGNYPNLVGVLDGGGIYLSANKSVISNVNISLNYYGLLIKSDYNNLNGIYYYSNINGIIINGNSSVISNTTSNSCYYDGIDLNGNSNNLTNIQSNSNGLAGISIGSSFNILSNVTTMLNKLGVYLSASPQVSNTIINLTSTNNTVYDLNQSKVAVKSTYFIDSIISTYNLQNSSDQIFFQNSSSGEIRFLTGINGTGTNLIGNSTSDIVIINNSVFVNSVQSGLNRSANITLYNLPTGVVLPIMLRDGFVCPSSICYNFTSLNAGNVSFNVTGWSNYSIGSSITLINSCGILNNPNGIYLLQNNISNYNGTCFTITADNVTLDGQGFTINGTQDPAHAYWGVNATGVNNATIRNITILDFGDYNKVGLLDGGGIYLSANSSTIMNVGLSFNYQGIVSTIYNSTLNNISSDNNRAGIIASGQSNIFSNIDTSSNSLGTGFSYNGNFSIMTNITANSDYRSVLIVHTIAFSVTGNSNNFTSITSSNNIGTGQSDGISITGNNLNLFNITSLNNRGVGLSVSGDSANLNWANLSYNNYDGLDIYGNSGNFSNIDSSFDNYGIYVIGNSTYLNNITSNSNGFDGIYISGNYDGLSLANANSNGGNGMTLTSSTSCNFTGINASYNTLGNGVYIELSNSNILANVNASLNSYGILATGSSSNNFNNITTFSNSLDGIYITVGSSNILGNITSRFNSGNGITLYQSADSTNLSNAILNNNTNAGLSVQSSSYATISNITANTNGFGLLASSFTSNNFINLTALNNSQYDLNQSDMAINLTYFIDSRIASYSLLNSSNQIFFQNSTYAEIRFLSGINGTGTNFIGNDTSDIRLSNNSVFVNSAQSSLNQPANVTLYGNPAGSASNPRIFRNGLSCSFNVCYNFTSLTASTVIFNVTGWSNYSIGNLDVPNISFVYPTPVNTSFITSPSLIVNLSTANPTSHYSFVDFDKSLVGLWRMEQNNATFFADEGNYGYNGTCYGTNCPTFNATGKFGGAVYFNGSQYINITSNTTNLPIGSQNRTVSAWVMYNGSVDSQDRYFFSYGQLATTNFWGMGVISGKFIFTQVGANIQSNTLVSNGKWYMMTVMYNGTGTGLYVNGVLEQSATSVALPINTVIQQAHFGDAFSVGSQSFNGSVDDLIIFNRTLSSGEISSLYNASIKQYSNNFSSLNQGIHTFTGYAVSSLGTKNQTEKRTVNLDSINPNIQFVSPTYSNGTFFAGSLPVNISSSDANTHYTFVDFDKSLVAWFRFNNESGENASFFKDYSTYGNNMTCFGTCPTSNISGAFGKSINVFGASNSSLNASLNGNSPRNFTVSIWMSTTLTGDVLPFWWGTGCSGGMIYIGTKSSQAEFGYCGAGQNVNGGSNLNNGAWHNIIAVVNDSKTILYVDGLSVATSTLLPGSINGTWNLNPSARTTPEGEVVDEILVFNRTLSAGEISSLYNATANQYYNNFTVGSGKHNYIGYAEDIAGNTNQTDFRTAIFDSPPNVSLISPLDGASTTNRTPLFNWTGSDPDNNSLTYELNITCYALAGGICTGKGSDDRYYNNNTILGNTTFIIPGDLLYLYDHNYYYNWSVRAYDGTMYGNWTNAYRLNISSLVLISNPVNSVVFGSISLLASNDTTKNNPSPFVLQNDGNSFVNVTITGTSLWSAITNPSKYFQFMVGNNTAPGYSENGSFIWGSSSTLFTNVSSSSSAVDISTLNYSDVTDSARVDINVTVPVGEPPGAKNSTITFLAVLGE